MSLIINNQPDQKSFSLNPMYLSLESTLPYGTPNLRLRVDIYYQHLPTGGPFQLLTSQSKFPDANSQATFNLGELNGPVHGMFREQVDLPQIPYSNFTDYTIMNQALIRLIVFELSGTTPGQTDAQLLPDKWVVRGGIPWEHWPNTQFWTLEMPNNRPWLSTQPVSRAVGLADPLYLHYHSPANQFGTVLRCNVYYSDGTVSVSNKPFNSMLANMIYKVPAGFDMLSLGTVQPTKTPVRYTLQVVPVSLPANVLRTFYIDHTYYEHVRHFAYENSYGCVDIIRSTGTVEPILETEFETATRRSTVYKDNDFGYIYDPAQGQDITFNHTQQRSIKCNTGYKSLSEIEALADFYRSPFKYEWLNNQWLPIEVMGKKAKMPKSDSQLYSQEFEYRYLFRNHVWNAKRMINTK